MNKKLKAGIRYQMMSLLKPMVIFYAISYTIFISILILVQVFGEDIDGSVNGLEVNTIIFLGFCSVLTFAEDFKLFIQNGMTRKMIYISFICQFIGISFLMAVIDTAIAKIFTSIFGYKSSFLMMYGDKGNIVLSCLWLFLLYFMITVIVFIVTLFQNRVGKKVFLVSVIGLSTIILFLVPTVNIITNGEFLKNLVLIFSRLLGFADNQISLIYPYCTFAVISAIIMMGSYQFTKRVQI